MEPRREPGPRRPRVGAWAVLALVVAILLGGCSWSSTWTADARASHEHLLVPRPPGCGPLPDGSLTMPEERVEVVAPAEDSPTAVDRAVGIDIDLPAITAHLRELGASYRIRAEGRLPTSGVLVRVMSDGRVDVDLDALDEVLAAPFQRRAALGDRRLAGLMGCYARHVGDGRALEETVLRVLVPADPRACFRSGRLVPRSSSEDRCDARGVTLPALDLGVRVLGWPITTLTSPATIVVAPGMPAGDGADAEAARVLLHEAVHVLDNTFGLPPWVGNLTHYEQRAYYVQRQLTAAPWWQGATGPPHPVRYLVDPGPDA